jgi:hypothetical protein
MTGETKLSARRGKDESERQLPIRSAYHVPDANVIFMFYGVYA